VQGEHIAMHIQADAVTDVTGTSTYGNILSDSDTRNASHRGFVHCIRNVWMIK